jgi:hypothetical protein
MEPLIGVMALAFAADPVARWMYRDPGRYLAYFGRFIRGIEGPERYQTITLPTHEFIRRFLTHVLPKGYRRSLSRFPRPQIASAGYRAAI